MGKLVYAFAIAIALLAQAALGQVANPAHPSTQEMSREDASFAAAMQKLEGTWVAAFNAGDAGKVTGLYAPDAVLMRWDGSVHGRDSILAEFQRSAAAGTGHYVVHPLHVERSEDLGYETGAYNVTIRGRVVEGNYLMVVKNIEGQWKIVAHATVPNPGTR